MSTPKKTYDRPARIIHWLMAALILMMLFIGVVMVSISSAERQVLLTLHKSLGVIILILGVTRLAWRFVSPPPEPPANEPRWRRHVAETTHIVFYALMLTLPLIGWAMQSAGGYPVVIWGGLHLPPLAPHNGELHAILRSAHRIGAYVLYGLFLLHVSAALLHAMVFEDGTLRRMVGGRP